MMNRFGGMDGFGGGRGRSMFGGRFGPQDDMGVDNNLGPSFSMQGSATGEGRGLNEDPRSMSMGPQDGGSSFYGAAAPATFPGQGGGAASSGDPYAANPAPSPFSSNLSASAQPMQDSYGAAPQQAAQQTSMGPLQGGSSMQDAAQRQMGNAMQQRQPRFAFGGGGGGMRFGGGRPMMGGGMGWGGGGQQQPPMRPMMGRGMMGGGGQQQNPRMAFGGGPQGMQQQRGRMAFGGGQMQRMY